MPNFRNYKWLASLLWQLYTILLFQTYKVLFPFHLLEWGKEERDIDTERDEKISSLCWFPSESCTRHGWVRKKPDQRANAGLPCGRGELTPNVSDLHFGRKQRQKQRRWDLVFDPASQVMSYCAIYHMFCIILIYTFHVKIGQGFICSGYFC